jgi:hypothetical protein
MTNQFHSRSDPTVADRWALHVDAVADATRRDVLSALDAAPSEDAVLPVSDTVAPADVARTERMQILLHHVHLPKLSASGLVTWDRDAGTVSRGPRFDQVRPLLRSLRETTRDGPRRGSRGT